MADVGPAASAKPAPETTATAKKSVVKTTKSSQRKATTNGKANPPSTTPSAAANPQPSPAPAASPSATPAAAPQKEATPAPAPTQTTQAEPPLHRTNSALRRPDAPRPGFSVRFKENVTSIVDIPVDQQAPMDVWNVYSPVRYITRKEQRILENQRRTRSKDIVDYCSNLFESTKVDRYMQEKAASKDAAKKGAAKPISSPTTANENEQRLELNAVAASFIMSLWPDFPVEARPPMSIEVEAAFPHLSKGTHLCIFNEENAGPLRCTAALRLLRNVDGDEGSVAIYNKPDLAGIDGYIPLCFLHSVSRGLESIERHRYVKDGIVKCKTDEGKTIQVNYSRAFTLHCRAPQRFYVSFIAVTDKELDWWLRTLTYFVLLNSQCRAFFQDEHPAA